MIDEQRTLEIYGYTSDELKPKSNKPIVAVCEECGKYRDLEMSHYRELCNPCSHKTPEYRANHSGENNPMFGKVFTKEEIAQRSGENNPMFGKRHTDESKAKLSKSMRESEAMAIQYEKERGGNDLNNHHYIYDHSDLSLNTVKITRSDHARLHALLEKLGYIVPHINGNEVLQ